MKILPTKKEKKITLFFSLSARPCSHRYWARGSKEILATYFFAEELFVSLISVKFAIRLSLLQPSFQGPILLFLRSVSLIPESRRRPRERGCVYYRIEHFYINPSCNRVTNFVKYYPILQKTAIGQWPQTNNSDLKTIKSLCGCVWVGVCVCVCVRVCVCVESINR